MGFKVSKILVPFLLISFAFGPPALASGEFDAQNFREFVAKQMEEWNVPGAAVLLIKDGQVVFSEGFGYRDVERRLPVDSRTVFPIASCTKTFTPFSVGLLVDEGKVAWDTPIREYFPELRMYDDYTAEHITLRDVLCHRSGLPRHDRVWMYAGLTRDGLMSRLRYLQPSCGFREAMQYNNIVYSIAGVVVERVSGKRWENFVAERIFKPLGMNGSSLFVADIERTDNHALPYVSKRGGADGEGADPSEAAVRRIPYQPVNTTGPASCINSNLEDMANWILFQLNGGKAGGVQLVSPETIREIHSPQMSIPPDGEFKPFICEETPMIAYGLGWAVQPFRGRMMLNHSGGIDGFSSLVAFMPGEGAGVVVLTNMHTNMVPYIVAFDYFDRITGGGRVDRGRKLREDLETLIRSMQGDAAAGEGGRDLPPSHPLKDYAGLYANPTYGEVAVTAEGGALHASYRNVTSPMEHVRYDVFRAVLPYPSGDLTLKMTFAMDGEGALDTLAIPLQPGVDDIRFEKRRPRPPIASQSP